MGYIGMGGAAVPAAVVDRASRQGISIVRMYGSTEHPSITGSRHEDPEDKRGYTDGHPLPGVEIRLVGADGQDVAPGEPGEILSRGPDCCAGYTDSDLTAATWDADGWFRTGDIGVLDEDGYLRITDRVKDIIIRGGENVSAAEVEEQLMHLPSVAECAVVAAPDVFWRFHPRWIGAHTPEGVQASIAQTAHLDVELATGDCAAALAHLGGLPEVDDQPGIIGFCLGGTLAFRVASRAEPAVCVSYYGSGIPTMLDDLAQVPCPLLLHFGSLDPYIPGAAVEALTAATAGQRNVVINVEIAGHAFDNHEAPMFYAESAAKAAWAKTLAFLGEHLPAPTA
jgi:acyl-CoA synthetase (AMP-forming)/AMP-acid ligase II